VTSRATLPAGWIGAENDRVIHLQASRTVCAPGQRWLRYQSSTPGSPEARVARPHLDAPCPGIHQFARARPHDVVQQEHAHALG
jgi:hypothetical protein